MPTIRQYDAEADFDGMFAITREVVSEPPYEEARAELERYPRYSTVARVAEHEGAIIGFCAASYPYWNAVAILDYLVVAPAFRRQGIGAALVREVESELRAASLRIVCVLTAGWNTDAMHFYEKLGFSSRSTMPEYFGTDNDALWFDKRLT